MTGSLCVIRKVYHLHSEDLTFSNVLELRGIEALERGVLDDIRSLEQELHAQ